MTAVGYGLMSEEHGAPELARNAALAEEAGFGFAIVSDHFHPWSNTQGHSPFVWSVLGAISQTTERLVLGTGVTCPTIRIHPAIVAQAAATTATLLPGRFFLGVGSGEYLNEHILGDHWPQPPVRLEMLHEAIEVIRGLWTGKQFSHYGDHYVVEDARIYSLPQQLPPILVAASGPISASVAAEAGDGIIGTSPESKLLETWQQQGGSGPRVGMFHLAYAESKEEGTRLLAKHWGHAPLGGGLSQNLRTPEEFEAASQFIRHEDYSDQIPQGPDPQPVIEKLRAFEAAGFDHVIMHQVGPDQEGFLRFFEREIAPAVEVTQPTMTRVREHAPA